VPWAGPSGLGPYAHLYTYCMHACSIKKHNDNQIKVIEALRKITVMYYDM
jgi:Rps23 Pro-64 3,4-dihydroxylase Tpa1-like proline 4-hydroxylase